jgi:hypothetical protein
MKKFLFLALLLISSYLSAQPYRNALYATVQTSDFGYGLRYDHQLKTIGFYGGFTLNGNYARPDGTFMENHDKFSVGGIFYPQHAFTESFFTFGLNYNTYGKHYFANGIDAAYTTAPMSCDLGIGTHVNRFVGAFRWDVIKGEVAVDLGFTF